MKITYDPTSFASRTHGGSQGIKLKPKHSSTANLLLLQMASLRNFDCSDATKQGSQSSDGNTHPIAVMLRLAIFVLSCYVVTRSHPGQPDDLARETDWSKPDRPKIDGTFVKPRRFLAWVATSAARCRLKVLFIEQKSLRDQLTEILQEIADYTWTEDGLANFSIKIYRKGTGLETAYSILR